MIDSEVAETLVRSMREAALVVIYSRPRLDVSDEEIEELKGRLGLAIADALRPLVDGQS